MSKLPGDKFLFNYRYTDGVPEWNLIALSFEICLPFWIPAALSHRSYGVVGTFDSIWAFHGREVQEKIHRWVGKALGEGWGEVVIVRPHASQHILWVNV